MTKGGLMNAKSIAESSPWSILQCFWPALSDDWSWKPNFGLFESGRFTQVLLYYILALSSRTVKCPLRGIQYTKGYEHVLSLNHGYEMLNTTFTRQYLVNCEYILNPRFVELSTERQPSETSSWCFRWAKQQKLTLRNGYNSKALH